MGTLSGSCSSRNLMHSMPSVMWRLSSLCALKPKVTVDMSPYGDMSTVTFGFSAQSDESRHMTLGIECIKFLLEQDPDNVPIVQGWIDKWFWRGYRLLTLVA